MGKSQRTKGASGERELATLLQAELGIKFERNLRQYQTPGELDLQPVPEGPQVGYAIEVKRREEEALAQWWAEAHEKDHGKPVLLFYRRSRQPWKALVDLHVLAPEMFRAGGFAIIGFLDACTLLRESVHA